MTKASDAHHRANFRRFPFFRYIAVIAVFFSASGAPAQAELLEGTVIRVSDGDTVVVEALNGTRHKIRLLGIDAPERAQAYGPAATEYLRDRALGAPATIHWQVRDRYQRMVGKVFIGAEDMGLGLIRAGLAWHYRAYAKDQAPDDRSAYAAAEHTARAEGHGLWAETESMPPWDWRRARRSPPHLQNHSAATPQTPLPPPHWTD